MFGRYRNKAWTDRKLQKASARISKSTEEYRVLPYQLPKYRTKKTTNTDHLECTRRQHSIRIIQMLVERI